MENKQRPLFTSDKKGRQKSGINMSWQSRRLWRSTSDCFIEIVWTGRYLCKLTEIQLCLVSAWSPSKKEHVANGCKLRWEMRLRQSPLWCEGKRKNVAVHLSRVEGSLSALSNHLCPSLSIAFIKSPLPTQTWTHLSTKSSIKDTQHKWAWALPLGT